MFTNSSFFNKILNQNQAKDDEIKKSSIQFIHDWVGVTQQRFEFEASMAKNNSF
jgi:hypothetical protein